ncbi:hypothetical protein KIW84_053941 [Lathyrus oleraceus]|uniref:Serine hydroxymethyltransferase-like domain-containing protein n=1 Tax=Pisum sativum TaxID=3888 RepID=A0A9D5AGV8_PEA|nr:hypothetical protein KIW84_053941 [Pisum sativum]
MQESHLQVIKAICGALLAWQLRDSSELEEFDETLVHFIYSASIGLNHEGEKRFSLLEKTASIFRPKLIIVGVSAHPRDIDYPRFRKIAVTASVVDKQKELLVNKVVREQANSIDEMRRILKSLNHYEALGFNRHKKIDAAVLKKEYRKKAMLVHPDKIWVVPCQASHLEASMCIRGSC